MGAYRDLVVADGGANLLGYWPLDATYGVNDQAPTPHNATSVGSATVGGATGPGSLTATTLNGSSQCFTTAEAPYVNATVRTFEGWANRNTSTTIDCIIGGDVAGVGPFIRLASGANDLFFIPDSSTGSSSIWTGAWPGNGQWVYWMLVFNEPADTAALYINGALVSSLAQTGTWNASPGNVKVGAMGASTNNPFDGSLAHIAVYNGDLSSKAASHYAAGISADPSPVHVNPDSKSYRSQVLASQPDLYWRLDETAGTNAADSSGNGNTGAFTGFYTLGASGLLASDPTNSSFSSTPGTGGDVRSNYTFPTNLAGGVITVEAWAKWIGPIANTDYGIFSTRAGTTPLFLLAVNPSTGTVTFSPDAHVTYPAATWTGVVDVTRAHHYVVTFTDPGDSAELFIDGVSQGAQAVTQAFNDGTFMASSIGTAWSGTLDEVAVYPRILSASEILTHFYAGATGPISVQPAAPVPKPLLALAISLTDGRVLRIGPDEYSASQVPLTVSFETELPGGFGPADITIPRLSRFDPTDVNLFAQARIYDARNDRTLHLSRVVGVSEPSEGQIELQTEGYSKHLEDDNTAKALFYDRDLTNWQGASATRRLNRILNGFSPNDASTTWDPVTGAPGLETAFSDTWGAAALPLTEGWYYANGLHIAAVDYAWEKSSTVQGNPVTDPNPQWDVVLGDDDAFTSTDTTGDLQAAGPGSGTLTATTGTRKYVVVQHLYNAAGGLAGTTYSVIWTLLGVIGTHGLTLYPLTGAPAAPNTARGLLASDMVGYVISRWCPLLTYSTGLQGSIEPTSFIVPHSVYADPTTARVMVDGLSVLGGNTNYPMDWGVYDGPDGKPEFFYKTPGNYGKTWRARRDQATESLDAGPDAASRLNGVLVSYNDGTGTTHTVGPPGSGADLEDARLQDTDPTNPANADGARHWHTYDAGITSQAGAILIGQLVLADANRQVWRGTVNLKGSVYDDSGNVYPVARVRAGDQVVIEDDADVRPRRIINTSYDGTQDATSCSVGAPPNKLDVLLSRLGVVLTGKL